MTGRMQDTISELISRRLKSDSNHINTVKCKKIFYITHVQSEQIPIIYNYISFTVGETLPTNYSTYSAVFPYVNTPEYHQYSKPYRNR
jgi:hypothetical protein